MGHKTENEENFLMLAGVSEKFSVLKTVWNFAKTIFNNSELNNFISDTDKNGSTALHIAIGQSNKSVVEYLFRIIKEKLLKLSL